MTDEAIRRIVADVLSGYASPKTPPIPVEASARHVHLCGEHVEELFGKGAKLEPLRELSQPGEFLSGQRVRLIGPRGVLENVAVLGPARSATQVELSATDARLLGISPPARLSGDLEGAADLLLSAGDRHLFARRCAIIARNHIHMSRSDAALYGVADGAMVRTRVEGDRPLTFERVSVRVGERFKLAMHIDLDEANACLWRAGSLARLLPIPGGTAPAPCGEACGAGPEPLRADWGGGLVTARAAESLRALGKRRIYLPEKTILTPSAWDVLRQAKVEVVMIEEGESP